MYTTEFFYTANLPHWRILFTFQTTSGKRHWVNTDVSPFYPCQPSIPPPKVSLQFGFAIPTHHSATTMEGKTFICEANESDLSTLQLWLYQGIIDSKWKHNLPSSTHMSSGLVSFALGVGSLGSKPQMVNGNHQDFKHVVVQTIR